MGSGKWSATTYDERASLRARAGRDAFDYSHVAKKSGNLRIHQTLDPQRLGMRESRDSAEHPTSNSIIIGLDVTGSMDRVVRQIHRDLPRLHEMLLGYQYIPHPQIMFAAVGDATGDAVPLQVGQFESDNRMDQNLENMILEGGGGGQMTESYELLLYVAARHTAIDCWEKRQHKGYLFIIGDEMAYNAVNHHQVNGLIGDGLQASIPLPQMIEEVKQRYHVYFIVPGGAAHGNDWTITGFWGEHLGQQQVLKLESPEDTSQCIALAIGIGEGVIDPSKGIGHLQSRGLVPRTLDRLGKVLGSLVGGSDPAPPATRARRL